MVPALLFKPQMIMWFFQYVMPPFLQLHQLRYCFSPISHF